MKFALDYKKLHLRFVFGMGFIMFIVIRAVKRKDPAAAKALKPLCRDIKKLLKEYKRANGAFSLVEIESSDKTHILIKL